jgi:hypothetical protein
MRPGFTRSVDTHGIRLRDAAARRLRRITTAAAAGAGVLALVFAGLAAKAFPGRTAHAATKPAPRRSAVAPVQTAPPVVSAGSSAPAPSASAPSSPAPASAPPAVVSGGS